MMKIISSAELPRITSNQVLLYLSGDHSRSLSRSTMRLLTRSILTFGKVGTRSRVLAPTLRD